MTTGYIAEVDTDEGTRYITKQGRLSKVPVFWQTMNGLKKAMKPRYRYGNRYDPEKHALKTQVIISRNLEAGLRASTASRHSVVEFMQMTTPASKAPSYGLNRVFKLELQASGTTRKRFMGKGRFGKTWESAGALRLHITQNIERLATLYKGAQVAIITTDGLTTSSVTYKPIVEFYRESPHSNKQFLNRYGSMLSTFIPNTSSEYQ